MAIRKKDVVSTPTPEAKAPEAKAPAAPAVDKVAEETVAKLPPRPEDFGKDSGKIAFVASLGDPSRPDKNMIKDESGQEKEITNPTVVGYRIQNVSDENITIPDFGVPEGLRKDPMAFQNLEGTAVLKPGETADLTRVETAALISEPQYGTVFSGGDHPVKASYQLRGRRSRDGVTATNQVPGVALSLAAGRGSIKALKFINVIDYAPPEGDSRRGTRTPNPEFPKFASLAHTASRAGRSSSGASDVKDNAYQRSSVFLNRLQAAGAARK